MTIDVENFRNRRNDDRWNRVSVGDVIERMTWIEPDKIALVCTPDATINPEYQRVTYRQANNLINQVMRSMTSPTDTRFQRSSLRRFRKFSTSIVMA